MGRMSLQDVGTTACSGSSFDVAVQHRRKDHSGILQIWSRVTLTPWRWKPCPLLVRSTSSSTVDAAFQQIGALDENGFHPRRVTAVYEKFTALYEEEGRLLEPHRDYWQCGMTEHFLHVSKANFGAILNTFLKDCVSHEK